MGRTLGQYIMDGRKQKCKVCTLPKDVKKQIDRTNRKVVSLDTILEWLKEEHNIKITRAEYRSHCSAGHDSRRLPKS